MKKNSLKDLQKYWALFTITIPTLGFIVAMVQLLYFGISLVEVILLFIMYLLTIVGVELGFHRYFSHRSFQVHSAIRVVLAILGSMAAQGPLLHWVSNHRCHHQYTDRAGDPHSPCRKGSSHFSRFSDFFHAHIGWLVNSELPNPVLYSKDLLRDLTIAKISQLYLVWIFLGIAIPSILGGIFTLTWQGVFNGFLWGGLVRIFLVHHMIWSINSFTHIFGSRPFKTTDQSTNNVWLALPSIGAAWHNNHHAFPTLATTRLEWWHVDLGGSIIFCLEKLGLAWNVNRPTKKLIEARR
jgi:stearoyl-CoA desaturase (Delta-9 desaturase)